MLNPVQKQKFRHLFNVFDMSNNGSITKGDFVCIFTGLKNYVTNEEEAKQLMRNWWQLISSESDENQDSTITYTEWEAWAETAVKELSIIREGSALFQAWEEALFKSIERPVEGDYPTITVEEYQNWLRAFQIKDDAATIFAKLDGNGDGEIFISEFRDLLRDFFLATEEGAAGNYLWGNPFGNN